MNEHKLFQSYFDVDASTRYHITIVLLILICCSVTVAASTKAPTNVVVIVADDVGIGDVSCYGSKTIDTPHIDRLAAQGLKFNQAYTTGSVCNPTRYSIITGSYPCRGPFRVPRYTKQFNGGRFPLTIDPEASTLPRFMKSHGYRTAAIGKWHLGYGRVESDYDGVMTPGPVDIGFDVHFGVPGNHNDRHERYVVGDSIYRPLSVEPGPARIDDPARLTEPIIRVDDLVDSTLTQQACDFIEDSASQPFFLYLTYCATHTHITPRADFRGRSSIGQLGDYMMELDHHVGEIIDCLERVGLTDKTLLIFTSDNGGQENDVKGAGGDLNLIDASKKVAEKSKNAKRVARTQYGHKTNGLLRGYKGGIHEGGFRVPFLVRWPEGVPAGAETDTLLSLVDLFATLAGFIDKDFSDCGIDSIDQSTVLLGKVNSTRREKLLLNAPSGRLAIRVGEWKLLTVWAVKWKEGQIDLDKARVELYHLAEDPYEDNNLASKHPDKVAELKDELVATTSSSRL